MEGFTAPDLENGAIFHGEHTANAWVTEIQSVLVEDRGDKSRTLYLAHECRKERLPFCNGPLGGGEEIFMRDKPHEFLTFTLDGRFWEVLNLDTVVSHSAVEGVERIKIHKSFFFLPVTRPGWNARVRCPSVPATPLSWDDVHRQLHDGTLMPRRLFCLFSWEEDGLWRELYFPLRYVNFATSAEAGAYLQPISGTVLVPFHHSVLPAYFACAIRQDGEVITEFLVPRYVDPIDWLASGYGQDGSAPPFATLSGMMPAYVKVYDWTRRVAGNLTFYVYGEARDRDAALAGERP